MLFGFLVREERVICTRDVGLAYPGIEEYSKGWTVRPLKGYTSWVQIEPKMEDTVKCIKKQIQLLASLDTVSSLIKRRGSTIYV